VDNSLASFQATSVALALGFRHSICRMRGEGGGKSSPQWPAACIFVPDVCHAGTAGRREGMVLRVVCACESHRWIWLWDLKGVFGHPISVVRRQ
jgi:hypothetical protein